jgi:CBS domain-containing protein
MGLLSLCEKPPQVPPSASVLDAVLLMSAQHVGAVVVVEERKLRGVFTERDLMYRVVARKKDPATTPIGEVMTRNVQTVTEETSVHEAMALMRMNHFRHLPVVGPGGQVLGMVALRYLLYDLMDNLEVKVDEFERLVMEDSRGG